MDRNVTAPKAPVDTLKDRRRPRRDVKLEPAQVKLDRLRERVRQLMHR